MTRIGVLGGTFDPVHAGHLDVARAAQAALALDEVRLLPSSVPPHRTPPAASAADRLAMVELAVADAPGMVASDLELHRSGPSYTTMTLDHLAEDGIAAGDLFFITGADAFREITSWRDYPRLLDRCHFVAVSRPGCPAPSLRAALPNLASRMIETPADVPDTPRIFLVDAPTADVSATGIRERVADGRPITGLVPPAVATYIDSHRLYRAPADNERT